MFAIKTLVEKIEALSGGRLKSTPSGDAFGHSVVSFATLEHAAGDHVAFLAQSKYRDAAKQSKAGVLVLTPEDRKAMWGEENPSRALIETANPYAWFAYALQVMTARPIGAGRIDAAAHVDPAARVSPEAVIEAGACVAAGAVVGARVHLYPGVYVGEGAEVGDDSILYANVSVYHGCKIGKRVILHSGAVIGADGFGFAPFAGEWVKIPQVGAVRIEDDVEIGANTTVDRGAIEDTVVGRGSKLDNQIQLGHNDKIGEHTVMAACTGVAGSTSIGSHCMIGGAANINGHISIPDQSVVGPATSIVHWDPKARVMMGFWPAQDRREYEKSAVLMRRLSEMRERIRGLEAKVESLGCLSGKEHHHKDAE